MRITRLLYGNINTVRLKGATPFRHLVHQNYTYDEILILGS